ncbi:MAG: YdcF family protein [Bacteroidia bacterium]|nr:YdcF family protein [Bacteroidia bacterium]
MRKFLKKLFFILAGLVVLVITLYLVRVPILRGIGNFLIREDTLMPVDAIVVLSGNSDERAKKAGELYREKLAPVVIATGGTVNQALLAYGVEINDANLTRIALRRQGVDSTAIRVLESGTSTFEESEGLLGYAHREGFKRVIVVTSKFHTRRTKNVFHKKFREVGIDVLVAGAESEEYDVEKWWESEPAMIFVNNEYVKMLYYWLKY